MKPRFTYDARLDVAYVKFTDADVVESMESCDELLVYDLDAQHHLVGVEILSVSRLINGTEQMRKSDDAPVDPATRTITAELVENCLLFHACSAQIPIPAG
jgi:uncharacterized protein YuzE